MKKRINTDFWVKLIIQTTTGNSYDLSSAEEITVTTYNKAYPWLKISQENIKVNGNELLFQVSSEETAKAGIYNITVAWKQASADSETGYMEKAVDFLSAYELVETSEEEESDDLQLTGETEYVAKDGLSAYEVWEKSNKGKTEEDYYNYLKQPATDAAATATIATDKANLAASKADTATAKADAVTDAANIAKDKTITATTAANLATDKATTATANATAAADAANIAKDKTITATTAANLATDKATTATANANLATDKATTATANANLATDKATTATANATTAAGNAQAVADKATPIIADLANYNEQIAGNATDLSNLKESVEELENKDPYIEGAVFSSELDPVALEKIGDGRIIKNLTTYLVSANEDSSLHIIGALEKNNHFKFKNGGYAPVEIIPETEEIEYPWQTHEDKEYNLMTGFDKQVYVINYETDEDNKLSYFLYSYSPFSYKGFTAKKFNYLVTPNLPTSVDDKFRNLMFKSEHGSYSKGAGDLVDIFNNRSYANPITYINQFDTNSLALANNPDALVIAPYSPRMDWAQLAFGYAVASYLERLDMQNTDCYGTGISSIVNCNEANWGTVTGIRYKVNNAADWSYAKFSDTPSFYHNTNKGSGNWNLLLSNYYSKMYCDEIQYALSWAVENNIQPNTEYQCLGNTYYYKDIEGIDSLLNGSMNAQLFKKLNTAFNAYDAEGNELPVITEIVLQTSATFGIDILSADIYDYAGAGTELVAHITNADSGNQDSNIVDIYRCINQKKLDTSTDEVINENEKFTFEENGNYELVGHLTQVGGYYNHFISGTRFADITGGSIFQNAAYLYMNNYSSATAGQKVRMGVRGRGCAHWSSCSFRFSDSNHRLSRRRQIYGGCFQVQRKSSDS